VSAGTAANASVPRERESNVRSPGRRVATFAGGFVNHDRKHAQLSRLANICSQDFRESADRLAAQAERTQTGSWNG